MAKPNINFGILTVEETRCVVTDALNELSDTDAITAIKDYVFGDEILTEELIETLEEQK